MQRNTILKVLNPLLGLFVLGQVATGLLHGIMPRDVFETVHSWGGIAVATAATIHLSLNWNWIKANYSRTRPESTSRH